MTSRERVLSAFSHIEPDRVPVDFGSHRSSGIAALAYNRLRDYLGLPPRPAKVYDVIQQMALIDDDVLDILGPFDTVELGRSFCLDDTGWKEWTLPGGTDCLIPEHIRLVKRGNDWFMLAPSGKEGGVMKEGMIYFDQTLFPWAEEGSEDFDSLKESLDDIIWSNLTPPNLRELDFDELARRTADFRAETDRAIVGLYGGSFYETSQFLFRHDRCMTFMALEPERYKALLEKLLELHIENARKYLDAVGPYIDIIQVSDDLGMISGPQISPAMYKELLKPFHSRLYAELKRIRPGIKTLLHCCGGVRELYDDFIDAGVDSQNPVQTNCRGMDPGELKQEFGDRITLWGGGCDTAHVLPRGTAREVREHVLRRLDILAPGGGFVFQQIHNIVADVPPENIVAMFEAVKEFNGTR